MEKHVYFQLDSQRIAEIELSLYEDGHLSYSGTIYDYDEVDEETVYDSLRELALSRMQDNPEAMATQLEDQSFSDYLDNEVDDVFDNPDDYDDYSNHVDPVVLGDVGDRIMAGVSFVSGGQNDDKLQIEINDSDQLSNAQKQFLNQVLSDWKNLHLKKPDDNQLKFAIKHFDMAGDCLITDDDKADELFSKVLKDNLEENNLI